MNITEIEKKQQNADFSESAAYFCVDKNKTDDYNDIVVTHLRLRLAPAR
ncbi:MAG: hypothetical protein IJU12_08635 [Clostridia bacterium]|nr:hypothetical protein [Clostridia bacterium]